MNTSRERYFRVGTRIHGMARFINCVAFAFYYYAVTYIIIINVLWTEGVSEINY